MQTSVYQCLISRSQKFGGNVFSVWIHSVWFSTNWTSVGVLAGCSFVGFFSQTAHAFGCFFPLYVWCVVYSGRSEEASWLSSHPRRRNKQSFAFFFAKLGPLPPEASQTTSKAKGHLSPDRFNSSVIAVSDIIQIQKNLLKHQRLQTSKGKCCCSVLEKEYLLKFVHCSNLHVKHNSLID